MGLLINLALLLIGFVFLIKGADIFVDGASDTARRFRVPKMLIGLTIVSFGTSAPELAVSIQSILSGKVNIRRGVSCGNSQGKYGDRKEGDPGASLNYVSICSSSIR